LYFEVKQPKDKYSALVQYLGDNDGNGIVYCSTRKEVESVTEKLIADGYSAARYHAGLSDSERNQSQDDFLYDRTKIIVATNAFGMGIDKSDVRFVIHYNMPQNVESYYQEAGRAGRDGLPSDCILFYARKDINTILFLINLSENQDEVVRNKRLLNQMELYCETDDCLRRFMLRYFGEQFTDDCGNCGNCNGVFDETDVTRDAKKVLSHIVRLNRAGKRFMFTHTADILLGKSDDFTDLPTFGIMKGSTRRYIRQIVSRLTAMGYIYDDGYLSTSLKADEVLFGGASVTIRGNKADASSRAEHARKRTEETRYAFSEGVLKKLKELRLEIAREEKVAAFVIFSDATLMDMCHKHPYTVEEFLSVSGVGQVKLERYGERFLQLLRQEERGSSKPHEKIPELTAGLFLQEVEIKDSSLQISRVADNINVVLIKYGKPKTVGMKLNSLLVEAGFLESVDGVKLPSDSGREVGITTVKRNSDRGDYMQCLFGADAQRLCVELILKDMNLLSTEF
jgi:ATP-dependent DNA helicase RecQ